MEKFLCHPIVKGWLPSYLVDIAKFKQSQHIWGNLKDGLTSHLVVITFNSGLACVFY
jgi:hypothetical protein